MAKVATCPYCGGDHFTNEIVRGDAPNMPTDINDIDGIIEAVEDHKKVYGYWFNECAECKGWSAYKNGNNEAIDKKNKKPKKHSLGKIKK